MITYLGNVYDRVWGLTNNSRAVDPGGHSAAQRNNYHNFIVLNLKFCPFDVILITGVEPVCGVYFRKYDTSLIICPAPPVR